MLPQQMPIMPKNVAGPPIGGGASPVTAPGGGAGNSAASAARVKSVIPILQQSLAAFPFDSKENKALLDILKKLSSTFGSSDTKSIMPGAVAEMAQAAKTGAPLAKPPAPGALPPDAAAGAPADTSGA